MSHQTKSETNKQLNLNSEQVNYLLSTTAIRERAQKIVELTEKNQGSFSLHLEKMPEVVDYVLTIIRKNYPDLKIPFHSRWGHFRAGQIDRAQMFREKIAGLDALEKARTQLDLVITSVLLDAGAGADWKYFENSTQKSFNRSEGLGVASYYMFCSGVMCEDKKSLRADGAGLRHLGVKDLARHFQVSENNPLIGLEGRVLLLNNLGRAMENRKIFKDSRPGNILDYLMQNHGRQIPATALLRAVLDGLGAIWPGRLSAKGVNLGDVWLHSKLGAQNSFESLVPIHKLSQWMTYSLIEPIEEAGCVVTGVENLTGLAEYRNGGLMIDSGLLQLKKSSDAEAEWTPDSDLIIEWRALTVYLLDLIGAEVQRKLGFTPQQFPLAKVLEGGTWWAGRFIAQERRQGGIPPLNIKSDGTVF